MPRSIDSVIARHLCTGCGTCVGSCPTRALKMVETAGGLMCPVSDESLCNGCDRCGKVCPQMRVSQAMREQLADPYVGPVRQAFLGQAVEGEIAAAGQTGGLGRSLLAWSLESGMARWAVCVMDNPDHPLRPQAIVTKSPGDVLSSSRSKYCPVPVNTLIQTIRDCVGGVAYLGLGCHMQGLELAMEQDPDLREKIAMKIGLFCDRILSYQAVDYLIGRAGLSASQVGRFDYRDPTWRGWPGDIRIEDRDGRVHHISRAYRTGIRDFFTPLSCRFCIDKLNGLADLSLGDPYGLAHGDRVPTAVIARTSRGLDFLEQAHRAGRITLSQIDAGQIVTNQNVRYRVRHAVGCARRMAGRGVTAPPSLAPFLGVDCPGRLHSLWTRWACWSATFFQTPLGIAITRRLPSWLPRVYNFVSRLVRRLNLLNDRD